MSPVQPVARPRQSHSEPLSIVVSLQSTSERGTVRPEQLQSASCSSSRSQKSLGDVVDSCSRRHLAMYSVILLLRLGLGADLNFRSLSIWASVVWTEYSSNFLPLDFGASEAFVALSKQQQHWPLGNGRDASCRLRIISLHGFEWLRWIA